MSSTSLVTFIATFVVEPLASRLPVACALSAVPVIVASLRTVLAPSAANTAWTFSGPGSERDLSSGACSQASSWPTEATFRSKVPSRPGTGRCWAAPSKCAVRYLASTASFTFACCDWVNRWRESRVTSVATGSSFSTILPLTESGCARSAIATVRSMFFASTVCPVNPSRYARCPCSIRTSPSCTEGAAAVPPPAGGAAASGGAAPGAVRIQLRFPALSTSRLTEGFWTMSESITRRLPSSGNSSASTLTLPTDSISGAVMPAAFER